MFSNAREGWACFIPGILVQQKEKLVLCGEARALQQTKASWAFSLTLQAILGRCKVHRMNHHLLVIVASWAFSLTLHPVFLLRIFFYLFFLITNKKLYSCIIDTVESDFLVSEFSNFENVYLGAIKNVFENTLA